MSLVLARIDQRLIHGQVALGWMATLDFDHILVGDDELAADDWEREMLASAAPAGVETEVLSEAAAARRIAEGLPGRTILLVRSPAAMLALVRAGAPLPEVNVGGLYYREKSRRFLDYLYLTREDVEALETLAALEIRLEARDLPGNPAVDLNQAISEGRLAYDRLHSRGT